MLYTLFTHPLLLQQLTWADQNLPMLYWWVAIGCTGFLVLHITLSGMLGIDLDYDFDFDIGDLDLGDVSLSAFITLFAIMGWAGYLGYQMTSFSHAGIVGVSGTAGVLGFVAAVWLHNRLKALEQTGNVELQNAIGQIGSVYLTIPQGGEGQIQIVVQGKLMTLDARCDEATLPTGEQVIVYAIEEDKLIVGPYQTLINS